MLKIQAFIFDLDGVITDTAELHYLSWKQLADEEGIPFTRADNEQLRGVSRRESLERMLKGRALSEADKEAWMARKNRYYHALMAQYPPQALPNVRDFLHTARQMGLKIGLGSASRNARAVLDVLNLTPLFDAIGDAHSVVNPKPAADLFVWTAGRMGAIPMQTVIFEDSESGIDAAKAGGFWSVGIGHAGVSHADWVIQNGLQDITPQAVVERFGRVD